VFGEQLFAERAYAYCKVVPHNRALPKEVEEMVVAQEMDVSASAQVSLSFLFVAAVLHSVVECRMVEVAVLAYILVYMEAHDFVVVLVAAQHEDMVLVLEVSPQMLL
jgi:hypothetical protein